MTDVNRRQALALLLSAPMVVYPAFAGAQPVGRSRADARHRQTSCRDQRQPWPPD